MSDIFPPDEGKSDGLPRQSRPPDDAGYIPFSKRLADHRGGDPADLPDRSADIQRAVDRAALISEAEAWAERFEDAKPPKQKLATAALLRRLAHELKQAHNENGYNLRISNTAYEWVTNGPI